MTDQAKFNRNDLTRLFNGDPRLIRAFESLLHKDKFEMQYESPTATGFNVQINDDNDDIHLILTPMAAYATGTITLPLNDNTIDQQEILINTTQAITSLTVDGNGATVIGEPMSLSANDFFLLKYDISSDTWYRVG